MPHSSFHCLIMERCNEGSLRAVFKRKRPFGRDENSFFLLSEQKKNKRRKIEMAVYCFSGFFLYWWGVNFYGFSVDPISEHILKGILSLSLFLLLTQNLTLIIIEINPKLRNKSISNFMTHQSRQF